MYEIKYRDELDIKNSHNNWIKLIPKNWDRTSLKRLVKAKITDGPHETPNFIDEGVPFMSAEAIVGSELSFDNKRGYISEKQHKVYRLKSKVQYHDILFCKSGSTTGKSALVKTDQEFGIWSPLAIIRSNKKIDSKLLFYNIQSRNFRIQVENFWSFGTQPNIGMGTLENLVVPYSKDYDEQQKIANFLDNKTAQFDTIIAKKVQLIKKLEEAKKSLISEVVTGKVKIVDGQLVTRDASEMKDSGVEWLGMIPKDWDVSSIKHISKCYPSNVDKKSKDSEKNVLLCNYTDVYYNDYITQNIEFMSATASRPQIQKFKLTEGDIILTKDSESPDDIGIASYVDETIDNLVCGYHLTLIKANSDVNRLYLYYFILSTGVKNYFETVANGVTRYGIGISGFLNLKVALPQNDEQEAISNFIRGELEINNNMLRSIKKQIELLKQAKQSLISEAVTGKIDLRDWEIIEGGDLQ